MLKMTLPALAALVAASSITFAASAAGPAQARPEGAKLLDNARRILFLGDSITYDGRYAAFFDAWLTTEFPDRTYTVINVGLPSETVSGLSEEGHANGQFPRPVLSERLDRVLTAVKPELVIACYGMNCGIYEPFDEDRFAKYRQGIESLREAVTKAGADIVHVTPPVFDHTKAPWAAEDYNAGVLGRYGEWLLSKRADGWRVIDLHAAMTSELEKRRAKDPAFAFQGDGVHPGDEGHWFMARQIIRYFASGPAADAATPEAMLEGRPGGTAVLEPVQNRMKLLRDAWLSHTGHKRPGIAKGLPLDEAAAKAKELDETIRGLMGES